MEYDYYTPGHKYLRNALFKLEGIVAIADFNNAEERQKIHDEFNQITHMLRETAKYEKENCHPLIRKKEPYIISQIEAGYKVAEEHEIRLRNKLGELNRPRLTRAEQQDIYQNLIEFVDIYRQQLSFKEKVLLPLLCKYNSGDSLRALALQSRSQMSLEQLQEVLIKKLMPCVNFFEKIDIIRDIKDGSSLDKFSDFWNIISPQFKSHQQTIILSKLENSYSSSEI